MNPEQTEPFPEDWSDLKRRAKSHRRWFRRNQPKTVSDVVAQAMQRRGLAQTRVTEQWDEAWNAAVGKPLAAHTRVGALKRGVLEVIVANSLILQELGFEKQRLLAAMQKASPDAGIQQLRFRIGKTA